MNSNDWMNNPLLKDIDPIKLQLLTSLANEGANKKQNELMPFFMYAMSQAKQKGVSFNDPEKDLLLNIMMQNLSPAEKQRAETIIKMASTFHK